MQRIALPSGRQVATKLGRRSMRYAPEWEMRRPEDSSANYRAVQDWKPMVHEVAHSAGKPEAETSLVIMHMLLIDKQGFRWPVRFKLEPGMTLYDVISRTDQDWFGVIGHKSTRHALGYYETYFNTNISRCAIGQMHKVKCFTCAVMIPYEYLDAMAPPNKDEMAWFKCMQTILNFDMTGNMRAACQVYVEDWMDGMTICLPQEESFAFNMYYMMGVDKESADSMTGNGHSGINNTSTGYLFMNDEQKKGKMAPREAILNSELAAERGEGAGYSAPVALNNRDSGHDASLSEIFWCDYVDDIIRFRYPTWKGRYEFLNK